MITVELTKEQYDFIIFWLECYECPIHCLSGNCRWCKLNTNSLKAMIRKVRV